MVKITLKVAQVVEAIPVLKKIFESENLSSLKLKFRINTIVDAVDKIGSTYQEVLRKLVATYGTKNEEGEYTMEKEKLSEFNTERSEFLSVEQEIEFLPLPLSLLEADNVTNDLTAVEVRLIMPFIEDDQG